MNYNLTERQKDILRWIVRNVREGGLAEEFNVLWFTGGFQLDAYEGDRDEVPEFTRGVLDALEAAGVLLIRRHMRTSRTGHTFESSRDCVLLGRGYEAVDSDFSAPDTSFVTQLTPLADLTNLDGELKSRCLPILGAGSADPKLWDSAVRTAGVILEERLRDVGGIGDEGCVGRDLVNTVFGQHGTLAEDFAQSSEREGYRDLYAGVVGALRNPYAHRLVDPTPEDGGATIVFVNLLLEMLEDLR